MSAGTRGARRISETASRAVTSAKETRPATAPVVDPRFISVCGAVLLSVLITAALLATCSMRPLPTYAIVGSALFGAVFGTFLVAALHLAITDSRRHKDDH